MVSMRFLKGGALSRASVDTYLRRGVTRDTYWWFKNSKL